MRGRVCPSWHLHTQVPYEVVIRPSRLAVGVLKLLERPCYFKVSGQ